MMMVPVVGGPGDSHPSSQRSSGNLPIPGVCAGGGSSYRSSGQMGMMQDIGRESNTSSSGRLSRYGIDEVVNAILGDDHAASSSQHHHQQPHQVQCGSGSGGSCPSFPPSFPPSAPSLGSSIGLPAVAGQTSGCPVRMGSPLVRVVGAQPCVTPHGSRPGSAAMLMPRSPIGACGMPMAPAVPLQTMAVQQPDGTVRCVQAATTGCVPSRHYNGASMPTRWYYRLPKPRCNGRMAAYDGGWILKPCRRRSLTTGHTRPCVCML